MGKTKNWIGETFERLTVIKLSKINKDKVICKCVCGTIKEIRKDSLSSGNTRSCGCLQKDACTTHGLSHHYDHKVWCGIRDRTLNINHASYFRYGGRGITLYKPWRTNFKAFHNYVSKLPNYGDRNLTLDRINNDKGYKPGNLRWVTRKIQQRNLSTNHIVKYKGKTMPLVEAAELAGLKYKTVVERINSLGWTAKQALSIPIDLRFSN